MPKTRLQNTGRGPRARRELRASTGLEAALRALPGLGLLLALLVGFPSESAHAQTPATSWGYMSGSENLGVDDTSNVPGARDGGATWVDLNGNLWLFGGFGPDAAGNSGALNDLWEYSPSANTWTLKNSATTLTVPGANQCNAGGLSGSDHAVGGRGFAATWVDASGNLWLFGGSGCSSGSTTPGYLNDLWMYDVASSSWNFKGGHQSTTGQAGVYGQQSVSSSSFLPGARLSAVAWTGADGAFWLFGGIGVDSAGNQGYLNDLWKFDPITLQWTWVSGGLTADPSGSYGIQGLPASSNVPGGRQFATGTTDSKGNLWLFGGFGCNTACSPAGSLNDLWMFNPTTLEWTWEAGGQSFDLAGNAGTEFLTASSNSPGSRYLSHLSADAADNFWLFGGKGYDTLGISSDLNDLWEFDTASREWTFMGGSPTGAGAQTPVYGTQGTPSTANIPGGREDFVGWSTLNNSLWLFGGLGYNGTTIGGLSDLWQATLPTPTPAFNLIPGIYQGKQTLTITDALGSAAIYYTTNGNQPTVSSSDAYTGPITVKDTEYVQAIAVANGQSQSLTRGAQFVIEPQTAITWIDPAPITYGEPLSSVQLDASTNLPGQFIYTPEAGLIEPAGTHSLAVTFTPSDATSAGFQGATATVNLQVKQAIPSISWTAPASISDGTALSAVQLDATASYSGAPVAGTYSYSPAAGTLLTAGTNTLNVNFTPTDTVDYATVTASTTVNVLSSDFTLTGSPTGQTVYAGSSTDFVIRVAPVSGSFSSAVALSVTGLPSGATATFSNSTIPPSVSAATSILTITVPGANASSQHAGAFGRKPGPRAPLIAFLLVLPFLRTRKAARKLVLPVLLTAALGAMMCVDACGSSSSQKSQPTTQLQKVSILTVSGTGGGNTQVAQLVLTVD